jgi:hypothetical protein
MNQALYAHMNNKRKMKKKSNQYKNKEVPDGKERKKGPEILFKEIVLRTF